MEKIEKDGRIAVLYSPGFGAGWSTWADDNQKEALCMDARIVGPFLAGDKAGAVAAAVAMFPDLYTGGADELQVMWIEKGKAFEVEEYEGTESVHVLGERIVTLASEPTLAPRGYEFKLRSATERRELVAICRTLLELGILQRVAGDEESFVHEGESNQADALYDVQRRMLAGVMAAVRGPSTWSAFRVRPC